jgi:integrase/recombinase XerD
MSKKNIVSINVLTWEEFSAFLLWDKKFSQRSSSVHSMKSRFFTVQEYFKDKEFTRTNFTIFIAEEQKSGKKQSTLNKYIGMAKHIDEYLKIDCLKDFTYFKERVEEVIPLTAEEVDKISKITLPYKKMKKELNERDYVMIQFLFATGCRIGELQNLKWVDVRNAPLYYVIFRETKNGEDHDLRITKRIYDMLQTLPRRTEFVFTSYRGDPINPQEFNKMIKVRAEKANVKKRIYAHIFRHSMGYYLGAIGFDEALIAKFLNHKNINTTKRYTQRDLEQLTPLAYANPLENPAKSLPELNEGARKLLEKYYGRAFNIIMEVLPTGSANFRPELVSKI